MTSFRDQYVLITLQYPYLPVPEFVPTQSGGRDFWGGVVAKFAVVPEAEEEVARVWHEAGHAAHSTAALIRDAIDGHGNAGDVIMEEFGAIVGLAPGALTDHASPLNRLSHEFVADAFMYANTGAQPRYVETLTAIPALLSRRAELLAYFKTFHRPRG